MSRSISIRSSPRHALFFPAEWLRWNCLFPKIALLVRIP
jgi:hypothetical protein